MPIQSAGILMYRNTDLIEVLLVHPGGPFFAKKDLGNWSIPKGIYTSEEDALDAAKREFREETGTDIDGDFIPLSPIKLRSGKEVKAWAFEGDMDPLTLVSNTFEMEWPPRSGKLQTFPEVDRAEWFTLDIARKKINERQSAFLDELEKIVR
ncbi:NUDIX domain-containing protein [Dyadobacter arcticus]|uniref:NUDIX family NTP pyrophosphohydrolase n=1 Tax=Dyadobacter arcticus TaxID=1078754 RepID=A0ABX0ULJ4_9BACT|nr:NUDIX domain-containing protein [Dyadobacter arcticus]NIJ53869.1 putative NUDIX family NTP pyrophosphohydrolase [Dyadobacter arcticus]